MNAKLLHFVAETSKHRNFTSTAGPRDQRPCDTEIIKLRVDKNSK